MTRKHAFLVAALVLSAFTTQNAAAQTNVAVVNVPLVSDKYQKTTDLEARFEGIRQKANAQRQELRDRIDRAQRSLQEELKPGTEPYRQRLKELSMLEAELKWFTEVEGQRIEQGLAQSLREIFDDIRDVIGKIAAERGIDVVVASDDLPPGAGSDAAQVRQQIMLQKVLYWSPKTDITQEVVSRLNASYQSTGGGTGAAPPAEKSKSDGDQ